MGVGVSVVEVGVCVVGVGVSAVVVGVSGSQSPGHDARIELPMIALPQFATDRTPSPQTGTGAAVFVVVVVAVVRVVTDVVVRDVAVVVEDDVVGPGQLLQNTGQPLLMYAFWHFCSDCVAQYPGSEAPSHVSPMVVIAVVVVSMVGS